MTRTPPFSTVCSRKIMAPVLFATCVRDRSSDTLGTSTDTRRRAQGTLPSSKGISTPRTGIRRRSMGARTTSTDTRARRQGVRTPSKGTRTPCTDTRTPRTGDATARKHTH